MSLPVTLRDIAEGIAYIFKKLRRYRKIPQDKFFRELENHLGMPLSNETKDQITEYLTQERRVVKSRYGKVYFLSEPIV